jgi:phage major head subunit gpT-like protein
MAELTTSQLQAFFTQLDLSQQRGYQKVNQYWDKYAMLSTSSSERKTYSWLAQLPSMKQWIGEKRLNSIAARSFEITNADFEETFAIDRNKLDDDQAGIYAMNAELQGQAIARWPDEQLTQKLVAGTTSLCYDGQYFFDTDHPVDLDNSAQGTYANLLTSRPLTLENFAYAKAQMRKIKGESGKSLQVRPTVLMVGSDNELAARRILRGDTINQVTQNVAADQNVAASAPSNVYKGEVELVVNEFLDDFADTAGAWYLFSTDRIPPLIWQVRKQPTRIPIVDPTNPLVFNNRTFAYSVEARANAGYGLPFLAMKCTP